MLSRTVALTCQAPRSRSPAPPATSIETCLPSRTISRPPQSTVAHVVGDSREDDGGERIARLGTGEPHRVEPNRHQVGDRARLDPPRLGPADRHVARRGRGPQQARRRSVVPALAGDQPLVHLHRPGLLEGVDHGVRVAAEAERRPRPAESRRGTDAVGEVSLGRRAEADRRSGVAEEAEIVLGEVSRVDRGEAGADGARPCQQRSRGHPVLAEALLVLSRLLGEVGVKRSPPLPRPSWRPRPRRPDRRPGRCGSRRRPGPRAPDAAARLARPRPRRCRRRSTAAPLRARRPMPPCR